MNTTIEKTEKIELNCLDATHLSRFLKNWIDSRNAKRSTPLSLRSVASNLGISASMLSRLISGTRNLSTESYLTLSEKMKLTPEEKEHFQRLVENAKSNGPRRERAEKELSHRSRPKFRKPTLCHTEETRYPGTEVLSFDEALLPDAKRVIERCLDELISIAQKSEQKSLRYHVGIQFFPNDEDGVA